MRFESKPASLGSALADEKEFFVVIYDCLNREMYHAACGAIVDLFSRLFVFAVAYRTELSEETKRRCDEITAAYTAELQKLWRHLQFLSESDVGDGGQHVLLPFMHMMLDRLVDRSAKFSQLFASQLRTAIVGDAQLSDDEKEWVAESMWE